MKITPFIKDWLDAEYLIEECRIKFLDNYEETQAMVFDEECKEEILESLEYALEPSNLENSNYSVDEATELREFYNALSNCKEDNIGLQKVYY